MSGTFPCQLGIGLCGALRRGLGRRLEDAM